MPSSKYPETERPCETCGTTLLRRRHPKDGRLEGFRDFARRRFCSLSCANSRSKGGVSRNAYLYHARKHLKTACEACGQTTELHAHHVNEDWTDNRKANIQTLCVFCHQFWHGLHRRLGLSTTKPMPKLTSRLQAARSTGSDDCAATVTPSSRRKPKPSLKR